ncbi:hypothetical protein V490_00612 [Pseudogymnoascus sp. VKM F-3557]|nr:hypothetical protein V490_00612 [Pseudogymnoascus sp. VKM F-3557]
MPIARKITPTEQEQLKAKVKASEKTLIQDVMSHVSDILPKYVKEVGINYRQFGKKTYGIYRHMEPGEKTKDVDLPVTKENTCIVYLCAGSFKVAGEEVGKVKVGEAEEGYLIEGETTIQLQEETAVVMFY